MVHRTTLKTHHATLTPLGRLPVLCLGTLAALGCSSYATQGERTDGPMGSSGEAVNGATTPNATPTDSPASPGPENAPATTPSEAAPTAGADPLDSPPPRLGSSPEQPAPGPSVTPPSTAGLPSSLLNLLNWKLTLPLGAPDEIEQPALSVYQNPPHFLLNDAGDAVLFRAHAGGATTENSGFPRSELREMTGNGRWEAAWSANSGRHTMTLEASILHLPNEKSEVVVGQIHDEGDDVVMIRLNDDRLFAESDGDRLVTFTDDYTLGTWFTVTLSASEGEIRIFYNGSSEPVHSFDHACNGCYFKAGNYLQSNTESDDADEYGEVALRALTLSHED